MTPDIQRLLEITPGRLDSINAVFLDPHSRVMRDFLGVVARDGTPEEINRAHRESRKRENLFKQVQARAPEYIKDLNWLIEQRDRGAFISREEYRRKVLGEAAHAANFDDQFAVTLEVSALQYFPWVRKMAELAIARQDPRPRAIHCRPRDEGIRSGRRPARDRGCAGHHRRFLRRDAGHERHRRLQPAPRRGCHHPPAISAALVSPTSMR